MEGKVWKAARVQTFRSRRAGCEDIATAAQEIVLTLLNRLEIKPGEWGLVSCETDGVSKMDLHLAIYTDKSIPQEHTYIVRER